jgi:DNA polymerase III sliding clamp (beta) subunit (PCNA family)
LTVSCFNGETAARAMTSAQCDEDLSACVDAMTLKAIVETLAGEIQLLTEGSTLVLQSSSNRTTLRLSEEDLPIITDEKEKTLAVMPGSILRSLARTLPFASSDAARMMLQVLHLTFDAHEVIAQTADGYSAALVHETVEGSPERMQVAIPIGVARLLATLVDDKDRVSVQTSGDKRYLFHIRNEDASKDLTLATVTGSENFPAEQIGQLVLNSQCNAIATLNVQQPSLTQTVRMVHAMNSQSTFIKAWNGTVKMASTETDTGQARNILEGNASGENTTVWLSASYLKRACEACKGELILRLSGKQKPVLIENGSFAAVIMPMLVEDAKDPFPEDEGIAIMLPALSMMNQL